MEHIVVASLVDSRSFLLVSLVLVPVVVVVVVVIVVIVASSLRMENYE